MSFGERIQKAQSGNQESVLLDKDAGALCSGSQWREKIIYVPLSLAFSRSERGCPPLKYSVLGMPSPLCFFSLHTLLTFTHLLSLPQCSFSAFYFTFSRIFVMIFINFNYIIIKYFSKTIPLIFWIGQFLYKIGLSSI